VPGAGRAPADDQDPCAQAYGRDALWRETGNIVLAQELLRHESVGTTQAYLHPTREDLAAGMRRLEESWERK
jgi:hypothetical protein